MNIPVPNFIETKAIFSQECGCDSCRNDNIRRDCYWYHCEHQMGASIDCCTLANGLGDCPCSDDCKNYISTREVREQIKYRMPKPIKRWNTKERSPYCPNDKCGRPLEEGQLYCSYCGQAVKWE